MTVALPRDRAKIWGWDGMGMSMGSTVGMSMPVGEPASGQEQEQEQHGNLTPVMRQQNSRGTAKPALLTDPLLEKTSGIAVFIAVFPEKGPAVASAVIRCASPQALDSCALPDRSPTRSVGSLWGWEAFLSSGLIACSLFPFSFFPPPPTAIGNYVLRLTHTAGVCLPPARTGRSLPIQDPVPIGFALRSESGDGQGSRPPADASRDDLLSGYSLLLANPPDGEGDSCWARDRDTDTDTAGLGWLRVSPGADQDVAWRRNADAGCRLQASSGRPNPGSTYCERRPDTTALHFSPILSIPRPLAPGSPTPILSSPLLLPGSHEMDWTAKHSPARPFSGTTLRTGFDVAPPPPRTDSLTDRPELQSNDTNPLEMETHAQPMSVVDLAWFVVVAGKSVGWTTPPGASTVEETIWATILSHSVLHPHPIPSHPVFPPSRISNRGKESLEKKTAADPPLSSGTVLGTKQQTRESSQPASLPCLVMEPVRLVNYFLRILLNPG
ncbi:hypothetical protein PVAR5_8940 [Paecilomyces variotii No. 5]|uniref:Uncharacterized protein n=1 Tax=Byssochlamys spectabilis (strain No. 5 / NBRC 109023) TaxID=1356009 RepID=V5GDN9_BYSSN|nr:hypothetical protein PVAR5_8940 [Paecilomyces variotii No. 5]